MCNGTGLNQRNESCFCVQPCVVCGSSNRGPLGHCRPCNSASTQRYQKRLLQEKLPCPTCGVFDRSASGACRPCFKRRNSEKITNKLPCLSCGSKDWNNSGGCRPCLRQRKAEKWPLYLLADARKRNKKLGQELDLDEDWIRLQYALQNGKCPFTNVRLKPEKCGTRSPFQPSLDRIDGTKPYSQTNCRLTCLGWNFMRNSSSIEETVQFLECIKGLK